MTWLPAFKIGVWNAWTLMLFYPLHPLILIVVDKVAGNGEIFKKMGNVPKEKSEQRINLISTVIMFALIVYSVFLPLKIGTAWFYAGLAIYLLGLLILLTATVNAATTPSGQPFVKGIYHYSRHPMYFSISIILVGMGVASASWVFLLLSAIYIILLASQISIEERGCLETFGDEYREYLTKTPRWIGIPKSR